MTAADIATVGGGVVAGVTFLAGTARALLKHIDANTAETQKAAEESRKTQIGLMGYEDIARGIHVEGLYQRMENLEHTGKTAGQSNQRIEGLLVTEKATREQRYSEDASFRAGINERLEQIQHDASGTRAGLDLYVEDQHGQRMAWWRALAEQNVHVPEPTRLAVLKLLADVPEPEETP